LGDASSDWIQKVALGGSAKDFHVTQISDMVFWFLVSCREVGFLINHLQFYECDSFRVFFHLWNNGGANWKKELGDFEKEESASWHLVARNKINYADAVKKPPVTGANSTPIQTRKDWRPRISVFDRLGNHHSSHQQAATKKSIFHWFDLNHNGRIGKENSLIPKKSVFDRLDFDLQRVARVKNMDQSHYGSAF
jgi:hypothetical protein